MITLPPSRMWTAAWARPWNTPIVLTASIRSTSAGVHRLETAGVELADPGVKHDDVERPDQSYRLGERLGHPARVGDIALDHPRAGRLDLGTRLACEGHDVGAGCHEPPDDGEADPRRSAGHERGPAGEGTVRVTGSASVMAEPSHSGQAHATTPLEMPAIRNAAGQARWRLPGLPEIRYHVTRRSARYRMGEEQAWFMYPVLAVAATAVYYVVGQNSFLFNLIGLTSPILIIVAVRIHKPEKRVALVPDRARPVPVHRGRRGLVQLRAVPPGAPAGSSALDYAFNPAGDVPFPGHRRRALPRRVPVPDRRADADDPGADARDATARACSTR